MCKGFIKLCSENFIFIHSSTKQHRLILYWRENFNLRVSKNVKEILHNYVVLRDILYMEGGNAVPNFDMTYKMI